MAALLVYFLTRAERLTAGAAAALVLPLTTIYAFMCLSAWYSCRGTPIATSGFPRIFTAHLLAASIVSLLWVVVAQVLALALAAIPAFNGLDRQLARQVVYGHDDRPSPGDAVDGNGLGPDLRRLSGIGESGRERCSRDDRATDGHAREWQVRQ